MLDTNFFKNAAKVAWKLLSTSLSRQSTNRGRVAATENQL